MWACLIDVRLETLRFCISADSGLDGGGFVEKGWWNFFSNDSIQWPTVEKTYETRWEE